MEALFKVDPDNRELLKTPFHSQVPEEEGEEEAEEEEEEEKVESTPDMANGATKDGPPEEPSSLLVCWSSNVPYS